ncbi:MAG: transaldolase [Bacteroidota bacterium]
MKLKVKLFADGAERTSMIEMYNNPIISGFTTNPTLMKKAGITDYKTFAKDILTVIKDKPISFEVFSDEFDEMERQALEISSWGKNVYVKIPVTNTKGESSVKLIEKLSKSDVRINVTALMTVDQVKHVLPYMADCTGGYVSVFAGRIADAGVDPLPIMSEIVGLLKNYKDIELIWASPRELYNVVQADSIGCHIITATNDILKKLPSLGKDLTQFSLETVKMFYDDARAAGYKI